MASGGYVRNREGERQMRATVQAQGGWQKGYDTTKRARDLSSPGTASYALHNRVVKAFDASRTIGPVGGYEMPSGKKIPSEHS